MKCTQILAASLSGLEFTGAIAQQLLLQESTNFSELWNATDFPLAQTSNVSLLLNEALELAGEDLFPEMEYRCIFAQRYPRLQSALQSPGFVKPTMAFNGFYFVGQNAVSAWAVDTGDGLVVIDALNNADEAENILIPGLQAFGYEGSDIKALIITHEHFDHWGGSRYIQDTFGVSVYASPEAWDGLAIYEDLGGPKRDHEVVDGQELTWGNFTVRFVATPGHTPGCMTIVFNVTDGDQEYKAAMYGGLGIARNLTDRVDQVSSYHKMAAIIEEEDIQVNVANHPAQDGSLSNFEILGSRDEPQDGRYEQTNPYVIGSEAYARYLRVMALCTRLQSAREGKDMPI